MPTMSVSRRFGLSRPRLLDRYIVREMLAPSAIGLLVFTFVLLIDQIPRLLAVLVARSADLTTILRVFLNLLPSILAVTIPMAFLLGVLLAFGRLASDSEIVALRAVGVSPLRLLAPVMMLAAAMTALTFYINAVALPRANQAHRELVFSLVVSKARTDVKARTFTDSLLPGRMMLYVQDIEPDTGRWKNLLIHDTRDLREPKLILAKTGELVVDRDRQIVRIELGPGSQHSFFPSDPREYNRTAFGSMGWDLPVDEFFPDRKKLMLSKGDREMTLGELASRIAQMRSSGQGRKEWGRFSVEWHKKFAIPAACLVFGLLGLGLSLGSKKEARSSAFALSIAVIFVYYVLIRLGEQAGDTGMMTPFLSMWAANLVLGAIALALLWLNDREAAFDPLDPAHYLAFVPKVRRQRAARPAPTARSVAPLGAVRPVVVVRIPRLTLRFPSLLDRYIARSWVGNVMLVLVAFMSIYVLGELMDLIDDIQQHSVKGKTILHYYAFNLWQIGFTVAPVAVLVGVLVTLGLLARRNEITAMKAGGISVYRAAGPVLGMGILASLLLYGMQEWVLPTTNKAAALDRNVIKGRPAQSSDQFDRRWVLASDERFYNFDYIVERNNSPARGVAEPARGGEFSVYGFSIYDVDPKTWDLRERLFASRAAWNGATRTYELERGWRRATGARSSYRAFTAERVRVIGRDPGGEIEPPSYFRREEKPSDTMGFAELTAYIRSLESRGFDVAKLKVQLHRKLAFPMVGFIMTLLAVPFSFIVARRGALYGIGIAIVIAIVYWAALGIFEALGNNALLHPALAAWAPNLAFGAIGLYLIFTLET
jgi:LPS export ABC transporter permease LptF/LPS export ABC transporter permease LptG